MRLTFKSVDLDEGRLPSLTWVSLIQSVEGLSRLKELASPTLTREFSSLLPLNFICNLSSSLVYSRQPSNKLQHQLPWISYLPTHPAPIELASLHKHRFPVTQLFP